MTHDDELIERVKAAMILYNPNDDMAQLAITAVRAYDAERRASVLDVAGVLDQMTATGAIGVKLFYAADFYASPTHDPDDYRDLPLSMMGPVRFKGGLTEG